LPRLYPPLNFQCPYKDCCPYLNGMSTKWVKGSYERSLRDHCDHWRVRGVQLDSLSEALNKIAEMEKENEELRAKLKAIHQRQFKANRKKGEKANEDTSKADTQNKNKKRGAPKGHPGWYRRNPDHIDQTIGVSAPTECPHCSCSTLIPTEEVKDHLQEDIVLQPRTRVINFKHSQAFCPQCNKTVFQKAEGELPNCHIGPVTKATAVFLRYGLRIPYRKVEELFKVLFNMPFVPATAMAFDRTATDKGEPLYEDLREKIRAATSIHADETSWRQDGIGHYAWYAGNKDLALFHIDRHRSTVVAQSILGNKFDGVLNTDGYAAYNGVNANERQSCLAHLIRKAKEIKKEILLKKPRFRDCRSIHFCESIAKMLSKACEINRKKCREYIQPKLVAVYEKRLYSLLATICMTPLKDKNAEYFRKRLLNPKKEFHRLFTFLKYLDVEPTNNQAEQSIRNLVIFRKISFGTRSAEGSRTHSVLPSLILTAQRQNQHPLQFLQTLFTAESETSQKALFNNSS
jgi:transposase